MRRASMKEASMADIPQVSPAEVPPRVEIVSADDWLALPDAHRRHELVAGHLTLVPATDLRYDLIASDLARAMRRVAPSDGMVVSQTGFVVSAPGENQTVLVPALAYVSAERLARVPPIVPVTPVGTRASALARVAPDLVVEIASPGQREPELAERVLLWHSAGVRLVWIVWPGRRQVDEWTLGNAGTAGAADAADAADVAGGWPRTLSAHDALDGGDVLMGFAYAVAHLFL